MIASESFDSWTTVVSRLVSFILLYPEIHYTFKYFPFSRYRIREPEILTDAPYRVDPGKPVPVLLLIKDADRFPLLLNSITFRVGHALNKVFSIEKTVSTPWWHQLFYLEIPDPMRGKEIEIQSEISCQISGREKTIFTDNFPGLSHGPLKVFCAHERLPGITGWVYGDLHYHTNYTSDQVEFGAPLDATVVAAKSIGLEFFAATDHSYDLDDYETDYLNNDPDLCKWQVFKDEVTQRNAADVNAFVILPGEEVTCTNAEGRNIHCLVIHHPEFIPGSGDSAERWFKTDSELSIEDVGGKIRTSSIALAAHPKDPAPPFERIFIRRGQWQSTDCEVKNICGMQILNGLDNQAFREGLRLWTKRLLGGDRMFIFAGNDAHGNFNRFRQVKTPMLKLHEIENHQRFGWTKTCVWLGGQPFTAENMVRCLKNGRAVITNGPLVVIRVLNESDHSFEVGDTASGKRFRLVVSGTTSEEMGALQEIRIILGELRKTETVIKVFKTFPHPFLFDHILPLQSASYVRCEAVTAKKLFCYTNPIWLKEK